MLKTEERLEYGQLLEEYVLGCKTEQRIGMEFERIPVSTYGKNVIPYEGEYGICELLREFAKLDNWDYILDGNEIIISGEGIEDIEMLRVLKNKDPKIADALTRRVVRGFCDYTSDVSVYRAVRKELLEILSK